MDLKLLLPRAVKKPLRRAHQNWTFQRALAQVESVVASDSPLPADLTERLVYGWSNEGWSAKPPLVEYMLNELRHFGGTMLECGSGLSTILMQAIARQTGARILSLEHDEDWYQLMKSRLRHLGYRTDGLLLAPLCTYGDFDWYGEHPALASAGPIHYVLCDGPPNSTRGGRYGLLPRMLGKLAPGASIIVDDAQRHEEAQMIQRWLTQFPNRLVVVQIHLGFSVLSAS